MRGPQIQVIWGTPEVWLPSQRLTDNNVFEGFPSFLRVISTLFNISKLRTRIQVQNTGSDAISTAISALGKWLHFLLSLWASSEEVFDTAIWVALNRLIQWCSRKWTITDRTCQSSGFKISKTADSSLGSYVFGIHLGSFNHVFGIFDFGSGIF